MSTYFARTENLSDEELRKIYEQTPKEKLIDMLIESNHVIRSLQESKNNTNNYKDYYDCSDWRHCNNPFHDCINCPLMFSAQTKITNGGENYHIWPNTSSSIDIKLNTQK